MRTSILRFFLATLLVWFLVNPAFADLTGDVQGTVTDPAGAAVVGAKVTIQNLSTGQIRVVESGTSGEFSAPQLEIGTYQVTIEKDGFKSYAQNAGVQSGEKTRLDARLEVGSVSQTVT